MYRKLLSLTLMTAALAACSNKTEEKKVELQCNDPAVLQNVRNTIQESIKQEARAFVQNDDRQFVDADKIIAAASELVIGLTNPSQQDNHGTPICSANLTVQIPGDTLNTAQTNAPLLYGDQTLTQVIQQRLIGSTLNYDGAGNFTRTLRYTPTTADNKTTITYEDNSLSNTGQTLSAALLPYGIKSILIINGQAVTREDAILLQRDPSAQTQQQLNPQSILENNAANQAPTQSASEVPEEVLSPSTSNSGSNEVAFSAGDLEQAKADNHAAEKEINGIWNRMDQTVQQKLLSEQRSWIQNKSNSCSQAAARANSTLQGQYLQLQCDTRMTRERSQYLRGYTIN